MLAAVNFRNEIFCDFYPGDEEDFREQVYIKAPQISILIKVSLEGE